VTHVTWIIAHRVIAERPPPRRGRGAHPLDAVQSQPPCWPSPASWTLACATASDRAYALLGTARSRAGMR